METIEKLGGEDRGQTADVRTVAVASMVGTTVEWFDFFGYATAAALVFGLLFFPGADPLVGTMLAFGGIAAGYLSRPLGSIAFGHYGDRLGRKTMLVVSLFVMGAATFLIGVLPTYAAIGATAAILLLVLRFIQGFALGGEWGGAVLMAVEHAPPNRRGFYGSFPQTGVALGLLLATLIFLAIEALPEDQLLTWGWRVPFLASALLVALGLYIRLKIVETPAFQRVKESQTEARVPFVETLLTHWKEVILTCLSYLVIGGIFYVIFVFSLTYGTEQLGLERSTMLLLTVFSSIFSFFGLLFFGHLSDRVGRKRVYVGGSLLVMASAFPIFWLINTEVFVFMLLGYLLATAGFCATYGPMGTLFSEAFDVRVRYTGISLGLTIGTVLGAAFVPMIFTQLLASFGSYWPISVYLIAVAAISAVAATLLRTTGSDKIERPEDAARTAERVH
ncbi:MFS transporter [Rubrobacter tropicus]|uniref:MFS transporter n=1 Tax=Rubrobacter tropicus TaxID=2653851 RepID=A0A6G8Q4S8_9ACTN|nr:MFS transporter [Rubrobacter tropicus]QIN81475.1 MFS transporter [Rubrobacter tropicus]